MFAGKVIFITGATEGIGRATALHFASLGVNVLAASRDERKFSALASDAATLPGRISFHCSDVRDDASVAAAVQQAVERFGRLDFAFNNAGVFGREATLGEHDEAQWSAVLDVMLSGVYRCMKHQVRAMHTRTDHGAIINNASIVGLRGSTSSGIAYTAAKHGVIGLTKQAAVELAGTQVTVNAVCPGPTLSAATAPLLEQPQADRPNPLAALNPKADLVRAGDIAAAVAYLCSPAAAMINGQALALDGGQLAKL